jgi:death-on-curing protein
LIDWLERRDVDFNYDYLMTTHGGLKGSPNEDALAATLARPQQILAYEPDSTLYDLASAYAYGFARNHCYPDGNKRMALAAMDIFLMLNGVDLVADEAETVVIINAVAGGDFSQEELASWVEQNCRPLDSGEE